MVARIRLLENTLKQHNIPIPSSTKASKSSGTTSRHNEQELINNSRKQSSIAQSNDSKSQNEGRPDRERALIDRIDKGNSLTPGLDPEIELLVKRTGSLQFSDHGQLKYFGATSNVHFLRNSIPFQPPPSTFLPSSAEKDKSPSDSSLLEEFGDLTYPVSRELEDHLIQLYFTWENPYFRVVDEESFMSARQQALSRSDGEDNKPALSCYSEFLVNVMFVFQPSYTTVEKLIAVFYGPGVLGEHYSQTGMSPNFRICMTSSSFGRVKNYNMIWTIRLSLLCKA